MTSKGSRIGPLIVLPNLVSFLVMAFLVVGWGWRWRHGQFDVNRRLSRHDVRHRCHAGAGHRTHGARLCTAAAKATIKSWRRRLCEDAGTCLTVCSAAF